MTQPTTPTGSTGSTGSALDGLEPVLSAPKRLAAMALVSRATDTDFAFLRAHLDLSDSDLSKQMSALEAAGFVKISKSGRGRGSTTTYQATRAGRSAYARHRSVLEAILRG